MNVDELKERIQTELQKTRDTIEETPIYIELRDKYENLTPQQQKGVVWGTIAVVLLLLFSIPLSYFQASGDAISTFKETRALIRDMLKTHKEAQEGPEIPIPPPIDSLKSQIESQLQSAQLLPEQMKGASVEPASGNFVNANLTEGIVKISLADLNLRQIVDLGYQVSSITPSAKLKDLQIQAAATHGYFDVVMKLLVLKVKQKAVANEPEEGKGKPKDKAKGKENVKGKDSNKPKDKEK